MANDQAAKRYAQAAFELAKESSSIATWRSDLQDVATVLSDSEISTYFANTKLSFEERAEALGRVLDVQPLALNLAKLLLLRGRSRQARGVANAFAVIADAHEGIEDAEVVTAVELDMAQRDAIGRQLSAAFGKQIRLTSRVDPAIIGGVVVRVGDRLIDGSIRTRLRLLRRDLAGVS